MKKTLALIAGAMFLLPAAGFAAGGLVGQCADCHTMHNSEQGAAVALQGTSTVPTGQANPNLLKMDCIACHASGGAEMIVTLDGGSEVPQVYHTAATDLAGGNFMHIATGADGDSFYAGSAASRKGHNVSDLFAGGDNNADAFGSPPGMYYNNVHGGYFGGTATPFANFTCAGSVGCHGTRSQMLSGYTDANVVGTVDGADFFVYNKRRGLPAVSGAHHNSYDGAKDPAQNISEVHEGADVADSYRFIKGLKGTGSPIANRWQNLDSANHNEYFGLALKPDDNSSGQLGSSGCNACHQPGTSDLAVVGGNSRMTLDSTLKVPNQSMSGFCITCHGRFHSSATEDGATGRFEANGVSGAFLRHPSDYVIPGGTTEYAAYQTYDITAPVARPSLYAAASTVVSPGTDMVMCLSCHQAHATPFDGMLRFDYNTATAAISAGSFASIADAQAEGGCLACHTTKGVLPENRGL